MIKINLSSPVPIYEQLVSEIKNKIDLKDLSPGTPLPTIRSLASQLDVAVNTVARAYRELERLDLIESTRRKGSFVRRDLAEKTEAQTKIFKKAILSLLQNGLGRREIETIFQSNMRQIFD